MNERRPTIGQLKQRAIALIACLSVFAALMGGLLTVLAPRLVSTPSAGMSIAAAQSFTGYADSGRSPITARAESAEPVVWQFSHTGSSRFEVVTAWR